MPTCTTNAPCGQGACCEDNSSYSRYQECTTSPGQCYLGDGSRDEYAFCTADSQCATKCCNRSISSCYATSYTSFCMVDSNASSSSSSSSSGTPSGGIIAMIVVFVLAAVVFIGISIYCKVKRARRNQKQGFQVAKASVSVSEITPNQLNHNQNTPGKPAPQVTHPGAMPPVNSAVTHNNYPTGFPPQQQTVYPSQLQPQPNYVPQMQAAYPGQPPQPAFGQQPPVVYGGQPGYGPPSQFPQPGVPAQVAPQLAPQPLPVQPVPVQPLNQGPQPFAMPGVQPDNS